MRDSSRRAHGALVLVGATVIMVVLALAGDVANGGPPSCFGREATITSNAEFVPGTEGPDVIVTGNADNGVVALGGADRVCLGEGEDFARGDTGNDHLAGQRGPDKISGGSLSSNETGSGDDHIGGGRGGDELNGHDGADVIKGGDGNDIIRGGRGYDICDGGPGRDTLSGCEE